jgi:hypothetical protein
LETITIFNWLQADQIDHALLLSAQTKVLQIVCDEGTTKSLEMIDKFLTQITILTKKPPSHPAAYVID